MAIITFSDSADKSNDSLPWADDYYKNLSASKQKRFMDTYFLVTRGNEAGVKGWIVETKEFKVWVWRDALNPLVQAISHVSTHECGLVCKFNMTKTLRLRPEFAVDSEVPALYRVNDQGFFQVPIT